MQIFAYLLIALREETHLVHLSAFLHTVVVATAMSYVKVGYSSVVSRIAHVVSQSCSILAFTPQLLFISQLVFLLCHLLCHQCACAGCHDGEYYISFLHGSKYSRGLMLSLQMKSFRLLFVSCRILRPSGVMESVLRNSRSPILPDAVLTLV